MEISLTTIVQNDCGSIAKVGTPNLKGNNKNGTDICTASHDIGQQDCHFD